MGDPIIGPEDPSVLHRRLADELTRVDASGSGVRAGLSHLCRGLAADQAFFGVTITVMGDGGVQGRAGQSQSVVASVDDVQFDLGEGPSADAFDLGRPVLVDDLRAGGGRWPGFAAQAQGLGVCAAFAFPLQLGALRFGVLTCYSSTPERLSRRAVDDCLVYADVATRYLIDRHLQAQLDGSSDRAPAFWDTDVHIRAEVYQAQGMVMVDLGVDLGAALTLLRAAAFAAEVSLNEFCADVVAGARSVADDAAPDPDSPDVAGSDGSGPGA